MHSDPILRLGEQIVTKLGLDDSTDTLGRWMAHYIAELIHKVDAASAEEQPARKAECATAILDLWEHRRDFPEGKRPFEGFDIVLRVLESLAPESDRARYFWELRELAEQTEDGEESKAWLRVAEQLDRGARTLIEYCIGKAAEVAADESQEWIKLALENRVHHQTTDLEAILQIVEKVDLATTTAPSELQRKLIEERIEYLDQMGTAAAKMRAHLYQQIEAAGDSDQDEQ